MRFKQRFLALWIVSLVFLLGGCLESGEQPILMSLRITPTSKNLEVSQTASFSAVGIDQHNNELSVIPSWSISNEIGTVSPTKNSSTTFTATKTGVGKLTATAGSETASINITVSQTLTKIEIQPITVTLYEKATYTFTAVGRDRFGNAMEITPVWSVTGGIGSVTPSSGSTVTFTATTPGSGTIVARIDELSGECTVQVQNEPVLTTIEVTPADSMLTQGQTMAFSAVGRDQYGQLFPIAPIWSVSNNLGTLSTTEGDTTTFTATHEGTGKLTAAVGNVSGVADLTVRAPRVLTVLKITPGFVQMTVNTQQTFTATGEDQYGDPVAVQPVWSVTNQIGSIQTGANGTAIFTSANVGNGVIMATVEGITASTPVSVFPIVQSITITPATTTLDVGMSQIFTATVLDEEGASLAIEPIWTVTNQIGTLIQNDDGSISFTAEKVGDGAIVASAGGISGSANITVKASQ